MRSRILLGLLFGAAGGFAGYALQEMSVPHDAVLDMTPADMMRLGAIVGALLGIALGAVEGVAVGSPRTLVRGASIGAAVGAIGGMFGVYFGATVYGIALFGKDPRILQESGNILDFTHMVLARALGWTFLGALPGLAAGASTLSPKRALHGLIGGLIGGFLGGMAFDLVASLITHPVQSVTTSAVGGPTLVETGGPSRAIGFTVIGALTGLFIGLVEELLKQGWVRVLAGRNEGKDYIVSKALTVIGRDERADVPVFGDPALQPQHAAIRLEHGRHVLVDGGAPPGPLVNGQAAQGGRHLLRDGDMIQLGQVRLLFREKSTATKIARPSTDAVRDPMKPAAGIPSHLCPFCGATKDAQGNCLCSVPAVGTQPVAHSAAGFVPSTGGLGSRIVALDGPYAGQSFPLIAPIVTIGRGPDRDVALTADTTVSRQHAHIALDGGRHVVTDDGSSNGTFVNGVRLAMQPLAIGDVIQLGSSSFRYE